MYWNLLLCMLARLCYASFCMCMCMFVCLYALFNCLHIIYQDNTCGTVMPILSGTKIRPLSVSETLVNFRSSVFFNLFVRFFISNFFNFTEFIFALFFSLYCFWPRPYTCRSRSRLLRLCLSVEPLVLFILPLSEQHTEFHFLCFWFTGTVFDVLPFADFQFVRGVPHSVCQHAWHFRNSRRFRSWSRSSSSCTSTTFFRFSIARSRVFQPRSCISS